MKFADYPYKRPDLKKTKENLQALKERMEKAEDYDAFYQAFLKLDQVRRHYESMATLANIRHTIDTRDSFYHQEHEFFNETGPLIQKEINAIQKVIAASPFFENLKQDVPQTWPLLVEYSMKAFDEKLIIDLQKDNQLSSAYENLIASAQIEFDGKTYTLASLDEKMNDKDEDVRKRAHKAYWNWLAEHELELGELYDQLVKVRTRMAKTLGYDNFIPLGYLKMQRLDYDQNDVAAYRKNVLEDVVPLATKLYQKQGERLGKPYPLEVWNEKVEFNDGNPAPNAPTDVLVERALKMYQELSPETGEFFQFMTDHDLMDLDAKPGKAGGGYCTFLFDENSPFIFSNANKTADDVNTLTHEAGHAFQCYSSKDIVPAECMWSTSESCEIHSMSMEFFTWPWMESFFDDAGKYRFQHLSGAVKFIPYGILVDHFQHEVYAHPEWNHEDRMACWRRLEKQYLPHKNYEGVDLLERGGWWLRQLHIFMDPFYYIDYTLAQVCALQFWKRLQDQDPKALSDYITLCQAGGTLPFRKLVKLAGLHVPFEPGCLKQTMQQCADWFEEHPACEN